MQDTEYMTLGMWIDYIIEWNNLHELNEQSSDTSTKVKKDTVRKATQADFDRF